uniref:Uncharacterized protein n=1 Tax=Lactuca sativa TaxID=4236 RepID=A0A9R1US80_LACSA|nr:hypothetical protein LSAT_V11C800405780 [Lactuca sativa]
MPTTVPPTSQQLAQSSPAPSEANKETTAQPPSQQPWPTMGTVPLATPLPKPLTFHPTATQFSVNQTSPFFTLVVQHQLPFFPATMTISQTLNTQPTFHVPPQSQIPTSTQPMLPPLAQAMTTPSPQPIPTQLPTQPQLIHPGYSLQLSFQQQAFYGPKPEYQAFYGHLGEHAPPI